MDRCVVFVAVDAAEVCGYARCIEDPGFGLYVIDFLVAQPRRSPQTKDSPIVAGLVIGGGHPKIS